MRVTAVTIIFLLNLTVTSSAESKPKSLAVSVDLGTSVLAAGETSISPFHIAHGIGGRVMIGSYTLPWATTFLAKGSVVPNGFAKYQFYRSGRFAAALKSSIFWFRLNDIDDDDLRVRSLVWPTRLSLDGNWSPRWSTSLEFSSVYVNASGAGLADNDTRVHGVAAANTYSVGAIQRFRVVRSLYLWARFRALLDHAPVVADASAQLSDTARVRVRAQANSSELRSGYSGMGGVHWQWRNFSLLAGVGYGTWILPWIDLPVGNNTLTGEFDVSYRF